MTNYEIIKSLSVEKHMQRIRREEQKDMQKDKYKIQRGDIFYSVDAFVGKIKKWEIIDIFIEEYISGNKTIIVAELPDHSRKKEFYLGDFAGDMSKGCNSLFWFHEAATKYIVDREKR